jgi:hypothetical protein
MKKRFRNPEMRGRAHRKKFSQPFDDPEKDGQ